MIFEFEFFTSEQVAKQICTTPYTVRKYARQGRLKAYKVGKRLIFKKADVELFIETLILKKVGK